MPDHETEGPRAGFGKWSQPGVPHRGWTCVDVEDLGEPCVTCQMCERTRVRYVHIMEHPDYPRPLECGCVCAGHMEEDLKGAKDRERRVVSQSKRRASWPARSNWQRSQNGNPTIKVKDYQATVFRKSEGYGAVVKNGRTGETTFSPKAYQNVADAKLAVFDAFVRNGVL